MVRTFQKTKKTKGVPDHVDKHVGKRLRVRRSLLGISQEKLAEAVGVTFQQIQKYERGTNRISASRLLKFSQILSVPVDFFYEHLEESDDDAMAMAAGMSDHKQDSFDSAPEKLNEKNLMEQKETLELIRVYYSVKDPKSRKDMMKILKTMAQNIS